MSEICMLRYPEAISKSAKALIEASKWKVVQEKDVRN